MERLIGEGVAGKPGNDELRSQSGHDQVETFDPQRGQAKDQANYPRAQCRHRQGSEEGPAQVIDQEVSKMVESSYQRALEIIRKNKDKVEQLANKLLEKEVIFKEDLELIFGERPYEERKKKLEKQVEEEMKKLKENNKAAIKAKKEAAPEKMLKEGKEEES